MLQPARSVLGSIVLFAALAACAGPRPPDPATEVLALPGPPGAEALPEPGGEPEDLPGVATSELVARERALWWKMVSQLYAPCSDHAVSIAQCVREGRACGGCVPAAQLIADKIRGGSAVVDVQAAYAIRFGPTVKQVEAGDSPALGPEGAPVVMVVWSDFECPSCGRIVPMLEQALERHAPNVRLVHKFYPLKSHKRAEPAARAAFAAKMQGKYWEMEHLIFANQQALEDQDLLNYAQKIGLNLDRFRADMESEQAKQAIARDQEAADRAGLKGTPFILINGREFDLGLFNPLNDLDAWITTEIMLRGGAVKSATGSAP